MASTTTGRKPVARSTQARTKASAGRKRAASATRKPQKGRAAPAAKAKSRSSGASRANGRAPRASRSDRATGSMRENAAKPSASTPHGENSLEVMLSDAGASTSRRWLPGVAAVKATARLSLRPHRVARRAAGLGVEIARIAAGRSRVTPDKRDKRFKDPAWEGNPVFRRLGQTYLAAGEMVEGLLADAELGWHDERRLHFAVDNGIAALSPTNFPLTNPVVLKDIIDSGPGHLLRGSGQFVRDMATPPRIPVMVDRSKFKVGENIAVTPGAVVLRTPVFELLQYKPTTTKVHEQPLLVVPPMINKYYVTDLAPGRSMIEYLVNCGQQVFAISWRNPDERNADWGLDRYAASIVEALDGAQAISGSERVQALGLCAGGLVLAATAAHLAARGELDRLGGITLGVCAIDNERAGTTSAFVSREMAAAAVADSARRGYLDGRALAGVFAWLRPTDLVWNYWVNNYLLGKKPPAFDILYWNSDTTNMPAALHRDFMRISLENSLVKPGATTVLDTPVDLSQITVDSYLVAGIADHIIPWQNAYRSTQLLGSPSRFVLSTSGHIAAMVNPPGNEKASFRTGEHNPPEAAEWLAAASEHRGSWWEDWAKWLAQRSGEQRSAPRRLGGRGHKVLDPAPGTYVHNA